MAATGGDGCGESPRSLQVPGPTAAKPRSPASVDRRTPAGSVAGSAVDPAATVSVRGDADIDGSDDDLDPVEAAGVGAPSARAIRCLEPGEGCRAGAEPDRIVWPPRGFLPSHRARRSWSGLDQLERHGQPGRPCPGARG